jgi:hypothetical protein
VGVSCRYRLPPGRFSLQAELPSLIEIGQGLLAVARDETGVRNPAPWPRAFGEAFKSALSIDA